jgi:hypothetical protein
MNDTTESTSSKRPSRLKAMVVAGGLTAGLLGGGIAGLTLGTTAVSGAQDDTTTTAPAQPPAGQQGRPDPTQRIQDVLAPLVAAGTIDQAQADAVTQALVAARPERGEGPGRGGHGRGDHGPVRKSLAAASTALGMTEQELATQLRDGRTIAQVAQERGVDVQVVIDALVAEFKAHLDEEVASGEHTREEADQKLAKATERITDMVNNGRPEGGRGPGGRGQGD